MVTRAPVESDQLSARSKVAPIELDTLPERGIPDVDPALFTLTWSEMLAARAEAATPTTTSMRTWHRMRICAKPPTRALREIAIFDGVPTATH
jgi:hypothetical protein